jgi:threonine dehydratase
MALRRVDEPTPNTVAAAEAVVGVHLRPTPVVASPLLGADVWLKLETLQPTGSFKVRGALAAVAAAVAEDPQQRLVTASAGNHGLGVAFAASTFGVNAVIVIPENASDAKRRALERFAVEVVRHGSSYEEAEAHALTLADDGARYVSAYNDPDVIAGASTIARELMDQIPGLGAIVAPVGGGGLVAGLCVAARDRPDVAIYGVEAEASPAVSSSVAAGRVVTVPIERTLADGLSGNIEPGSVTVALIARGVEQLAAVDEDSISRAVRFLAVEHGLVAEPSGAVAVAGLLAERVSLGPGPTAVVVSGRNITTGLLGELLDGER